MKKLILILTVLCFSTSLFSQSDESIQNDNNSNNQIFGEWRDISIPEFSFSIPEISFPEMGINIPEFNFTMPETNFSVPKLNFEEFAMVIPDFPTPEISFEGEIFNEGPNVFAGSARGNYKYEIEKRIEERFKVNANCKLCIDNRFGKIEIVEWDKNEIAFDILITGMANSEKGAQAALDCIDVDFSSGANVVNAKTKACDKNMNKSEYKIDYVVKVPASVVMDLRNRYGNIYLTDVQKDLSVDISYGHLYAHNLKGNKNIINSKYGNVEINEVTSSLNIDKRYGSKCVINKASNLTASIHYSSITAQNIEKLNLDIKYSNADIETVTEASISSGYSKVYIDNLVSSYRGSVNYGNLEIRDVDMAFSLIDVSARYSGVRLGLTKEHSFDADLLTYYGSIKLRGLTASQGMEKEKENNKDSVRAIFGNKTSTDAKVTVDSRYGDIIVGK